MLSSRFRIQAASILITIFTVAAATSCGGQATQTSTTTTTPVSPTYQLVWSDEFSGADGSAPDASKWAIQTGGNGWGNNELEYYTTRPQNVQVSGGNLVITAAKEDYTGPDGVSRHYTSARLQTKGLFSQQYGRFEARIKVPMGQGMWPAFWMLGNNIDTAGWPACGEIDIMENIGKEPAIVHGTLHAPNYPPAGYTASYTLPSGALSGDFHVFAVEWEAQQIRFYIDGTLYATDTQSAAPSPSNWPFSTQPFFILLNLAVGGDWPGNPDATTQFPRQMLVDYVRVYQKQ
ncbi:MAG TPA: glycoside hydrolase family 16 protein [Candidatus Sulfotelmatobacter sp.]|jgi:beta-glucanase (GH16 family)|nr:glycoside hydrolase family 16 protein [Candidatus Sulfotelmatobacter sp.]